MIFFECPKCGFFSPSYTSAMKHTSKHKGRKIKLIEYDTDDYTDVQYVCGICEVDGCDRVFIPSLKGVLGHLKRKHGYSKPRCVHYQVHLMDKTKDTVVLQHNAVRSIDNEDSKKSNKEFKGPQPHVELDVDKYIRPTELVTTNQSILRIPVMLIVNLAAGTSTIRLIDAAEL